MKKGLLVSVIMTSFVLMLVGCGSGVSEDKPIAKVKQEATTMNVDQLKSVIEKYKKAIEAKQPEIQALQTKLKSIPITQMLGEEAKDIKTQISEVASSIKALTERMKIYAAEISQKS